MADIKFNAIQDDNASAGGYILGRIDGLNTYAVAVISPGGNAEAKPEIFIITDKEFELSQTEPEKFTELVEKLREFSPTERLISEPAEGIKHCESLENDFDIKEHLREKGIVKQKIPRNLAPIFNAVLKNNDFAENCFEDTDIKDAVQALAMLRRMTEKATVKVPADRMSVLHGTVCRKIRHSSSLFLFFDEDGDVFRDGGAGGIIRIFTERGLADNAANDFKARGKNVVVEEIKQLEILSKFSKLLKYGVTSAVINDGTAALRIELNDVFPKLMMNIDIKVLEALPLYEASKYYTSAKKCLTDNDSDGQSKQKALEIIKIFIYRLMHCPTLYYMYNKGVSDKYPTIDYQGFAWFYTDEQFAKTIEEKNKNAGLAYKHISPEDFAEMIKTLFYRAGIINIRLNNGFVWSTDILREELITLQGAAGYGITNSELHFNILRFLQANTFSGTPEGKANAMTLLDGVFKLISKGVFVVPMIFEGEQDSAPEIKDEMCFTKKAAEAIKDNKPNFFTDGNPLKPSSEIGRQMRFFTVKGKDKQGNEFTVIPAYTDVLELNAAYKDIPHRICAIGYEDLKEQALRFDGAVLNSAGLSFRIIKENFNAIDSTKDAPPKIFKPEDFTPKKEVGSDLPEEIFDEEAERKKEIRKEIVTKIEEQRKIVKENSRAIFGRKAKLRKDAEAEIEKLQEELRKNI